MEHEGYAKPMGVWNVSRHKQKRCSVEKWADAQKYELKCAIDYMESDEFKIGEQPDTLSQFLTVNTELKRNLDVGACVQTPLESGVIIDPLAHDIQEYQRKKYGFSNFDDLELYSVPVETRIPELEDSIDGTILCRNMLDHTCNWPFALARITSYAKKGCVLLLWCDLHHKDPDAGHINITEDVEQFRLLIEQLGWDIQSEHRLDKKTLNWGCVAIK